MMSENSKNIPAGKGNIIWILELILEEHLRTVFLGAISRGEDEDKQQDE